jgi:hypothetical protein
MSTASLTEWLLGFRQLHERARRGQLRDADLARYRTGRDELARALLAAQKLQLKTGEVPRRALRVARALQVDLDFATSAVRAVTSDVSTGGFSCLLAKAPPLGEEAKYALRLPAAEGLSGRVRVQDVKPNPNQGNVRVSFAFLGISEEDKERVELFVFDTVLAQLVAPR